MRLNERVEAPDVLIACHARGEVDGAGPKPTAGRFRGTILRSELATPVSAPMAGIRFWRATSRSGRKRPLAAR
jgi:hypothetical protein